MSWPWAMFIGFAIGMIVMLALVLINIHSR
jgi:cyanate permease